MCATESLAHMKVKIMAGKIYPDSSYVLVWFYYNVIFLPPIRPTEITSHTPAPISLLSMQSQRTQKRKWILDFLQSFYIT